jgi:hypothetical protein
MMQAFFNKILTFSLLFVLFRVFLSDNVCISAYICGIIVFTRD